MGAKSTRPGADDPDTWRPSEAAPVTLRDATPAQMSANERIKLASEGLFFVSDPKAGAGAGAEANGGRQPFAAELDALSRGERPTLGSVAKELSKFFGIYKQQLRGERGRKTSRYIFMVRIILPGGGELDRARWCALDDATERYADGTLRITSRQGIQYHGVSGADLAPLIRHLNRHYRSNATLGACGDVNRNTMTSPLDGLDPEFAPRARELAVAIAQELAPRSSAYFRIFAEDPEGRGGEEGRPRQVEEPVYGPHYLPRKFKIGLAHPRDNSIDLRTQDIGLMPVAGADAPVGELWDLYSGGGLGMTHNNPETAPLLGLYLGRIRRAQVVDTARSIAELQKEYGERKNRRLARWKYTQRRLGVSFVQRELRTRFGIALDDATPVELPEARLLTGWHRGRGDEFFYGLSVDEGRIGPLLRRAIRAAVTELDLGVRLTPHQDLLLCGVRDRETLLAILDRHGVRRSEAVSAVRQWAMACPAKPTCGLAMTEAERILPVYVEAIEAAGFGHVDAEIRMTGCPNNCARPPSAEIGIYGYGKNDHGILVGGSRRGSRLARPLYHRIPERKMVPALVGLFRAIDGNNPEALPAGDWLSQVDLGQLRQWVGVEDGSG